MEDVSDIFITPKVHGPVGSRSSVTFAAEGTGFLVRDEFGGLLESAVAARSYEFTGYEHEDLRT